MKLGLSILCVLPAVLLGTLHLNRQALAQPRPVQMAPASAGMPPMPAVVREEPAEVTEARLKWFRDAPADGKVTLPGLKSAPHSGRLLAGGTAVKWEITPQGLVVSLPGSAPDPDVSVFALEFAGPLQLGG